MRVVPHQQQLHERCRPLATVATRLITNGTTNPAHAAAGLPDHLRYLPHHNVLGGRNIQSQQHAVPADRARTSCRLQQCHINNVFAGTPTDCYSCHKADYTGTTNPNHATADGPPPAQPATPQQRGFPPRCRASYHTFFPLNHGNANGVCATCHTNSSDYSVFTCTACQCTRRPTPTATRGVRLCLQQRQLLRVSQERRWRLTMRTTYSCFWFLWR